MHKHKALSPTFCEMTLEAQKFNSYENRDIKAHPTLIVEFQAYYPGFNNRIIAL